MSSQAIILSVRFVRIAILVALVGRHDNDHAWPPFSPHLQAGLDWLATDDNAVKLSGSNYYGYTLYGLERAGLASGFKTFGKHDWYRVLATQALRDQHPSGS